MYQDDSIDKVDSNHGQLVLPQSTQSTYISRSSIPSHMAEDGGLKKDCMVVGQSETVDPHEFGRFVQLHPICKNGSVDLCSVDSVASAISRASKELSSNEKKACFPTVADCKAYFIWGNNEFGHMPLSFRQYCYTTFSKSTSDESESTVPTRVMQQVQPDTVAAYCITLYRFVVWFLRSHQQFLPHWRKLNANNPYEGEMTEPMHLIHSVLIASLEQPYTVGTTLVHNFFSALFLKARSTRGHKQPGLNALLIS